MEVFEKLSPYEETAEKPLPEKERLYPHHPQGTLQPSHTGQRTFPSGENAIQSPAEKGKENRT